MNAEAQKDNEDETEEILSPVLTNRMKHQSVGSNALTSRKSRIQSVESSSDDETEDLTMKMTTN